MKFTHEGVEYEVAALAAWLRRCSTDAKYEQADEHADKLSAAAALLARHERVCEKARAVLSAAESDVGIAGLSKDGLAWECPKCGAGEGVRADGSERHEPCKPECTRMPLLKALDELEAELASAALRGEEAPRG